MVFLPRAQALIVFAHGSGSGRRSPRNFQVAQALNERRLGLAAIEQHDDFIVLDLMEVAQRGQALPQQASCLDAIHERFHDREVHANGCAGLAFCQCCGTAMAPTSLRWLGLPPGS